MNEQLVHDFFRDRRKFFWAMLLREHEYYIYRYILFLRREERSSHVWKLYWRGRKNKLGARLGLYVPADTCGDHLKIWHYGNVIINGYAKIGENVVFHGNNCVGNNGRSEDAPEIGNHVDVGFGAIIIGGIKIADRVKIGAGAVVNKSVLTPGVTIAGVPAKIIKGNEQYD